jgi:hypothetical protein
MLLPSFSVAQFGISIRPRGWNYICLLSVVKVVLASSEDRDGHRQSAWWATIDLTIDPKREWM